MDASNLLLFLTICVAATVSPGPAVVLAIRNGAEYGLGRACAGILGNLTAMMIYAALASSGTAIVFTLFPQMLSIFQILGGMYLIYLGYKMLVSAKADSGLDQQATTNRQLFWQALFTGLSNPKAIVFYASLFPQFITPGEGYLVSALLLSGIFATCSVLALLGYAYCASLISAKAMGAGLLRKVSQVSGGVFCFFGAALVYGGVNR